MGILIMHSYMVTKLCSWDKPEAWIENTVLKEPKFWEGVSGKPRKAEVSLLK